MFYFFVGNQGTSEIAVAEVLEHLRPAVLALDGHVIDLGNLKPHEVRSIQRIRSAARFPLRCTDVIGASVE